MQFARTTLLSLVVMVGLVAACGGNAGSGSEGKAGSTSKASPSGSQKTTAITETEFELTPSSITLGKTGEYTFKVVNSGSVTHALEIEGSGLEAKSGDVGRGQSKTFSVDLKTSGTYEMYCAIDGHRDHGMEGTITIGSPRAGPGGTTADTSTTETETHADTLTTETETHTDTTDDNGGGGGGGY
jgi:uncharacterized cupredoxin-like copper-binding protein